VDNLTASIPNPTDKNTRKKDADYVFYELTRSICPNCRKAIDAKILLRDRLLQSRSADWSGEPLGKVVPVLQLEPAR
jgi:hypothetical protein